MLFTAWLRTSCLFLAGTALPAAVCSPLRFSIRPRAGAAAVSVLWFYPERWAPRWATVHSGGLVLGEV